MSVLDFGQSLQGFTLQTSATDAGGMITKGKAVQPKRTLKARRPGGTNMPIKTAHGWEMDDIEVTVKGVSYALMQLSTGMTIASQQILIRGSFHDEIRGGFKTYEQTVFGRCEENDFFGEMEPEEDAEGKIVFVPSRSIATYGGEPVHFYDNTTGEAWRMGEDMTSAIRAALGRA